MYPNSVPALMSKNVSNTLTNYKTWGGIIYNVIDYKASGNGTTDDTAKIMDAVNAATVKGGIVFFMANTYRVSTSFTVPSNVTLWFANGAKLSIDGGITVTINGPIDAGLYQILSGAGVIAGDLKGTTILPQWWGVLGGAGLVDDAPAFQKCFDYVSIAGGGEVVMAKGIYRINSPIRIFGNNVKLRGSGVGNTKILNGSTVTNALNLNDTFQKLQITLQDFTIDAVSPSSGNGIELVAVNRSFITNVQVSNHFYLIKFGDGCFDVNCNNLSLLDVKDFGSGVRIDGGITGGGIWIRDSVIDCGYVVGGASTNHQGTFGIDIVSSAGHHISNIDIRRSGFDGLTIRPSGGKNVLYCWLNSILGDTSGGNGMNIDCGAGSLVLGISIDNCWGGTNNANGLLIQGAGNIDGIDITNFRSIDNVQAGIFVNGGKNVSITAGLVGGNSRVASNSYAGIRIGAGISGFKINGVRSGQSAGRLNTQSVGISVDAGTSNNYMITNCDLRTNVGVGLSDGGTGINKVVANNLT